ncbi:hypothetical protein J6590_024420 [Homalodisca vitripennis]|nr:hypothetical protein J6590_024420 [Homalodisca vitripennis]
MSVHHIPAAVLWKLQPERPEGSRNFRTQVFHYFIVCGPSLVADSSGPPFHHAGTHPWFPRINIDYYLCRPSLWFRCVRYLASGYSSASPLFVVYRSEPSKKKKVDRPVRVVRHHFNFNSSRTPKPIAPLIPIIQTIIRETSDIRQLSIAQVFLLSEPDQFLAGHGNFQSYLSRMLKVQTVNCRYCGEEDTTEHTVLGILTRDNLICKILEGMEQWNLVSGLNNIESRHDYHDLRVRPREMTDRRTVPSNNKALVDWSSTIGDSSSTRL